MHLSFWCPKFKYTSCNIWRKSQQSE